MLRAQIDASDREHVERGVGGRQLSGLGAGLRRAGNETLLQGIEAQAAVGAEDDQLAVYLESVAGSCRFAGYERRGHVDDGAVDLAATAPWIQSVLGADTVAMGN